MRNVRWLVIFAMGVGLLSATLAVLDDLQRATYLALATIVLLLMDRIDTGR